MRLCWTWILDPNIQWKRPWETLKELPKTFVTATIQAQSLPSSKPLYNLVTRAAPPNCADFRAQLTARAIKDLVDAGADLGWVHSGAQLGDCLTKIMENSFTRETLKCGKYCLGDELQVLKNRLRETVSSG